MELSINYLTVFNPELSDPHSESDDSITLQILCFLSSTDFSKQYKVKKIGLIQGINEFSKNFNHSNEDISIDVINTVDETVLVLLVEKVYFIVLSIQKVKGLNTDIILYDLKQAYSIFKIYNGSFHSNLEQRQLLEKLLVDYFTDFIKFYKYNVKICLDAYRKSRLSYKSPNLIDNFQTELSPHLNGLFIYSTSQEDPGIIHHSYSPSIDSLIDIANWIDLINLHKSTFQTIQHPHILSNFPNLTLPNLSYNTITLNDVNPINLTINGVNQLSNFTVNGVNQFSNGVNQISNISNYMPWSTSIQSPKGVFMVGRLLDEITTKEIHLDDHLYNIVVYYKDSVMVVLLFEPSYGSLKELSFYDSLQGKVDTLINTDNFEMCDIPSTVTNFKFESYYVVYNLYEKFYTSTAPATMNINRFFKYDNSEFFEKDDLKFVYMVKQGNEKILVVKKIIDNFFARDFKSWFSDFKLGS